MTTSTPTLASIAVTPISASVAKGATASFQATGTYSDKTTKALTTGVTWNSSSPSTATIGTTGTATAMAVGSTSITASMTSVTSPPATLTVTAPSLVSIAVTPATVLKGLTTQLVATGTYSDQSTANISTSVNWTSSATTIATIGATTGIATGIVVGTAAVTASAPGIVSPPVTLTVAPSEYAYVTNFADGTVSVFSVGEGGTLVPNANGPTVPTGSEPYALAVDSSHHYLYVVNYNADAAGTVSQYNIGTDGTLTPMAAPSIAAGTGPNGITVNQNNVYVANYGGGAGAAGTVSHYTIGPNGALVFVASVAAGAGATAVTINSADTFAYVTNFIDGTVSVFSIAGGGLTLANTTTLPPGTGPVDLMIDPTGQYAYVADLGSGAADNTIAQFSITAGSGALVPLSISTVTTGNNPRWLAVNPVGGNYLYVPNAGSNTVQTFTFGSGGVLTPAGTTTLAAATNPDFAVVDPTGQYLYLANRGGTGTGLTAPFGNSVSQFAIGSGGALTPLSTPAVTTGTEPANIVVTSAY